MLYYEAFPGYKPPAPLRDKTVIFLGDFFSTIHWFSIKMCEIIFSGSESANGYLFSFDINIEPLRIEPLSN
jgi:hypothetical protein